MEIRYIDFNGVRMEYKTLNVVRTPRFVGTFRQGYHVHLENNRRILGWVVKDEKTSRLWRYYAAASAFRGDTADDEGHILDSVPHYLTHRGNGYEPGTGDSFMEAAHNLISFLNKQKATALGYGRHPDVGRWLDDDEAKRWWSINGYVDASPDTTEGKTQAVIRWLHKEIGIWREAWEVLPSATCAEFTEAAKRWLGNESELRTATINGADWPLVYVHFHG